MEIRWTFIPGAFRQCIVAEYRKVWVKGVVLDSLLRIVGTWGKRIIFSSVAGMLWSSHERELFNLYSAPHIGWSRWRSIETLIVVVSACLEPIQFDAQVVEAIDGARKVAMFEIQKNLHEIDDIDWGIWKEGYWYYKEATFQMPQRMMKVKIKLSIAKGW